jgi:two-component system sensor histidine kinase DevS
LIRRVSLVAGLLAVVLLLLSTSLALYQAPRLPWTFTWNGKNWVVENGPPPLRPGEVLSQLGGAPLTSHTLLVDNFPLQSRAEMLAWLDEKAGLYRRLQTDQVELQVGSRQLQAPVTHGSWDFLRNPGLLHLPVGVAFFVVGWASYLRPGAGRQAFWFYLMCLAMSLVYTTNVASLLAQTVFWPPLWTLVNLLNASTFVLGPCLLFHFSLLIPRDRTRSWLLALIYGISGYVVLTLAIPLHGLVVPGFFLGSLLAILQATISYRTTIERQQMKWIGAGFALGVGPWLLINGFPMLLLGHRLMSDTVPGAFLIFIPLGMAVAVHRYRLFDIGTFLEGTFAYALTLVLLLLCEWAVLAALGLSFAFDASQVLLLAVLASGYGMVRWKLAGTLAGWFRRRPLRSEQALELLRSHASGRPAAEVLPALQTTVEQLLAPQWMRAQTGGQPIGARLDLEGEPTVLLSLSPETGLLCGPLPVGRSYSSETMLCLDHLARQSSLYLENARLFEKANQEQARRLEERERLLGDLHDGVGAALAGIRMLSHEPEVTDLAGEALHELQSFLYDSPDYRMERDRFVAELRSYGSRLLADREFSLQACGALEGTLPRSLALSLFRLLREAFNNARKHSGADRVCLSLDFSEQIEIILEDNGRGFSQVARGRGLASIEKRVADLGGSLQWTTESGVRMEIRIPL